MLIVCLSVPLHVPVLGAETCGLMAISPGSEEAGTSLGSHGLPETSISQLLGDSVYSLFCKVFAPAGPCICMELSPGLMVPKWPPLSSSPGLHPRS